MNSVWPGLTVSSPPSVVIAKPRVASHFCSSIMRIFSRVDIFLSVMTEDAGRRPAVWIGLVREREIQSNSFLHRYTHLENLHLHIPLNSFTLASPTRLPSFARSINLHRSLRQTATQSPFLRPPLRTKSKPPASNYSLVISLAALSTMAPTPTSTQTNGQASAVDIPLSSTTSTTTNGNASQSNGHVNGNGNGNGNHSSSQPFEITEPKKGEKSKKGHSQVVIIGSGPAGHTCVPLF